MAATSQQAVKDAIKTAGSEREIKFRNSIHLPFHQVGMSKNLPATYLCEADVPEYRDSDWGTSKPEWLSSKVELLSMEEIIGDTKKVAFLIEASRFKANGTLLQTFNVIFTVANKNGDWRLISCSPFNVRKA